MRAIYQVHLMIILLKYIFFKNSFFLIKVARFIFYKIICRHSYCFSCDAFLIIIIFFYKSSLKIINGVRVTIIHVNIYLVQISYRFISCTHWKIYIWMGMCVTQHYMLVTSSILVFLVDGDPHVSFFKLQVLFAPTITEFCQLFFFIKNKNNKNIQKQSNH